MSQVKYQLISNQGDFDENDEEEESNLLNKNIAISGRFST